MATGREMEKALYQGKALREQQEAEMEQRAMRAARDVLDKSVESMDAAAKGRGVSVERVRKAVKALREDK